MAQKKKSSSGRGKRRLSFSQMVFVAIGVIIILSMVISLVTNI